MEMYVSSVRRVDMIKSDKRCKLTAGGEYRCRCGPAML